MHSSQIIELVKYTALLLYDITFISINNLIIYNFKKNALLYHMI